MSHRVKYDDGKNGGKTSNISRKLIGKEEKPQGRWKKPEGPGGTYWDLPEPTRVVEDKSSWESNGCYPLDNKPTNYQRQDFQWATLADGASLKYDCFMPTGESYEFLPCAPHPCDKVIGYKRYFGTHRIMDLEGPPAAQEAFVPYKLLLYKGRDNANPGHDDWQRFVYLAENKPKEPLVGDCFVRLEEIHKRMNGTEADYTEDCAWYIERAEVIRTQSQQSTLSTLSKLSKLKKQEEIRKAAEKEQELKRDGKWGLRFRCWSVEGKECAESESRLRDRLFTNNVYPINKDYPDINKYDHLDVFKVWAELLRNSQGDKLGAKDFFGRYWDAVIPNEWLQVFKDGFRIIVGEKYFQSRAAGELDFENESHRITVRSEVLDGVQRAVNAPRLKLKPELTDGNIVFRNDWDNQFKVLATDWFEEGWRHLDGHPGGLYQIVVDLPVRQFLCLDTHKRPFWQEGYGHPQEPNSKYLNYEHLKKCLRPSKPTITLINTIYLSNLIKKRDPTQDRCVADNGYSANVALSNAFPGFYPDPAIAKKKRVAEWLHRSAFSYGGFVDWKANNSQTADNLVLGTPDTNTVMMRYEAFVKRLTIYLKNGENAVIVQTAIDYSTLEQTGQWMGDDDHQYTWLAANLKYRYYSVLYNYDNNTWKNGSFEMTRDLFPFNRESCMLFESILDKSLEEKCWGWTCWDAKMAVVEGLLESTGVDGDQEEANKDEVKKKLEEATKGDREGTLIDEDLNYAVQNLI